jgi:hypothetical protein
LLRLLLIAARTTPPSASVAASVATVLKAAISAVTAVTAVTAVWTICAVAIRIVLRRLVAARRIAAVPYSGVGAEGRERGVGAVCTVVADVDVAAALAIDRRHWWGCGGRRRTGRLGIDRRDSLGAGRYVRIAVAPDRGVGLGTDCATGVVAIRIVAGVRVGLVGRTSATAATRWASTFAHAIVG